MSKVKVLFYGSLRKGEYNYNSFVRRFGADNYQHINTRTINGFRLHSLGAYPAVVSDENKSIVVDEFLVSPECYNSVRSMELGAGYEEVMVGDAIMYKYRDENSPWLGEEVTHGDWSQYLRDNGK